MPVIRTTEPLRRELENTLPDRPFRLTFWDGTELPPTNGGGPALHLRSPEALAHALRAPGQLGLGRAYVSGALEVEDIEATLQLLETYRPPPLERRAQLRLAAAAARACGPMRPPPVPATELRPQGRRHSLERDRRSVRHHYDVSNEFFAMFLDESMTYSCAFFSRDGSSLEAAQRAKLELVCTKLALQKGERVLDVGCGWGSFAIHAAREHGVSVTGITLSEPQAELARRARRRGGRGRPGRHPRDGLPRADGRAVRRDRQHRDGRARRREPDRRVRAHARAPAAARRTPAQPRHRAAAARRARGRAVLRALRVPGRRAAAPVADPGGDRGRGPRDPPRRGLPRGLRGDAPALDAAARGPDRRGRGAGRARSASASGACTFAPPAGASRPASRRCTRFAARSRISAR